MSVAGTISTRQTARLSSQEVLRYSRHLIMPEVGMEGQLKLKQAKVLLIGAGGLGSPLGLYLAAAGVGKLGLVDFDVVDFTNLQRQILHSTSDVGRSKLASAKDRLSGINPHIEIVTHETALSSANALDLFRDYDIIADGTDNFPTRYLVNDACVLLGKPNVYGAVFRFEGQASVFHAARGPCYRCLYPEPPPPGLVPSCAEGGVLGVLPGIVGSLQALEALKLVLEVGESLVGRLVLVDGLTLRFRELALRKDPTCPVCGEQPTVRELIDYEAFCGLGAEDSMTEAEITPRELAARLEGGDVLLVDVREPFELDICRLEGALHIPLRQLPRRLGELDSSREIVTVCHRGNRSLRARDLLKGAGVGRVRSLRGGVDAWATEIDPSMERY